MPKYTFKTYQHGARGADAVIWQDGVHVHTTPLCQSFGANDTDRKQAARAAREWIAQQQQLCA